MAMLRFKKANGWATPPPTEIETKQKTGDGTGSLNFKYGSIRRDKEGLQWGSCRQVPFYPENSNAVSHIIIDLLAFASLAPTYYRKILLHLPVESDWWA